MGWQDSYKVIGVVPGKVVYRQFGTVDLSRGDIPVEFMDRLYKSGFPYLKPIKIKNPPKTKSPA